MNQDALQISVHMFRARQSHTVAIVHSVRCLTLGFAQGVSADGELFCISAHVLSQPRNQHRFVAPTPRRHRQFVVIATHQKRRN